MRLDKRKMLLHMANFSISQKQLAEKAGIPGK